MPDAPPRRWRDNATLRMAMRLHAIYASAPLSPQHALEQSMERLLPRLRQLQQSWRCARLASRRFWPAAEHRLRRRLLDQLQDLRMATEPAMPPLRQMLARGRVVHLRAIYEELLAVSREFDDLSIDLTASTVSVLTEPITLDDVALGRFRIVLDVRALGHRPEQPLYAVSTVAVDPNPAGTEPAVTHPHVRDDVPCLGDAVMPVQNALADGRLLDAFQLIDRVLQTYNDGSAYVQLEDWSGSECDDCGRTTSADDASSCSNCGGGLCSRCSYSCDGCDATHCRACLSERDGRTPREQRLLCEACLAKEPDDEDDSPDESQDDSDDEFEAESEAGEEPATVAAAGDEVEPAVVDGPHAPG